MTVQKNLVKNIYVGNGSTTQFPITFDVNTEHPEYIHVYLTNDDNITTETENFTVNLTAKTVTYPKEGQPLATGKKLVIMRELPLQQLLDLINQGDFFADDIEQAFDDLTMITQQLSEKLARAMVFSVEVAGFDNIIPLAPGMSFRINDAGTGLELTEDPAKVLPQAKNLLQQTTEQAKIATNKANAAADSALAAATSESNAGAHEDKAQAWAESETSPDGEPDSKSAKTWAGDSADSAEMAQKWAESENSPDGETDSESPTSETMSAKEWALYAKQLALQIGNPVVEVTESNGTVTVGKSDGTQDTFNVVTSVNGVTPTGGNVNVPQPNVMTGATDTTDGTVGMVPAPLAKQRNLFLRGDGTWAFAINDYPAWYYDRGNGSDGEFAPLTNTTIDTDKNYTSVNIPEGITVTINSPHVTLHCTGSFINNGTIDANGKANNGGTVTYGTGDGGAGGNGTSSDGGAGGNATNKGGHTSYGGAGGAVQFSASQGNNFDVLCDDIQGVMFGSGGGGGGNAYDVGTRAGAGGAGGGGLTILAAHIINSGTITANGANGSNGSSYRGGGGGGGGGAIVMIADTISDTGVLSVAAGSGGSGGTSAPSGAKGTDGYIRKVVMQE